MKKVLCLILIIIIGIIFGDMCRRVYLPNIEIKTEEVLQIKQDILSLDNQSTVTIQLIDNKKVVIISLEDLEYIIKKNSRGKKLIKDLTGLFERMK